MGRARASIELPGLVADAEAAWYDTARWPAFVDQLEQVLRTDERWPAPGAQVVWRSVPQGRGTVTETSREHEPRAGQVVDVEDEHMTGTQQVRFAARADGGVTLTLELSYRLRRGGPGAAITDVLFVRGPMRTSLQKTLSRFARELTDGH